MIVWGRSSAFNVQKVLWLLAELGLAFEHREVGGAHGGLDTEEFLARNPHGRIPVIEDADGTVVWESQTILRYLAAKDPEARFFSADPAERSRAERWMDWSLATFQPAFMQVFWGFYRTPPEKRNEAFVARGLETCDRLFRLLDVELAGRDYLGGDAFGLGDIPTGTALHRWFEMGLDVPRHPHVDAWYERLRERPAYRETIMTDFESLRGRLDY